MPETRKAEAVADNKVCNLVISIYHMANSTEIVPSKSKG